MPPCLKKCNLIDFHRHRDLWSYQQAMYFRFGHACFSCCLCPRANGYVCIHAVMCRLFKGSRVRLLGCAWPAGLNSAVLLQFPAAVWHRASVPEEWAPGMTGPLFPRLCNSIVLLQAVCRGCDGHIHWLHVSVRLRSVTFFVDVLLVYISDSGYFLHRVSLCFCCPSELVVRSQ